MMAQVTKIKWSPEEVAAAGTPDFFYVKHAVIQNVMNLFNECAGDLKKVVDSYPELKAHTDVTSPKIFRGENYLKLPYVVLDFPRKFSADSVFAFRSMFWWGKHFSFTMHLQGTSLNHYRRSITSNIHFLKGKDFYWCVNSSPWHYHFDDENYRLLDNYLEEEKDFEGMIAEREFIKLSRKLPVSDYLGIPGYCSETFQLAANMISGLPV